MATWSDNFNRADGALGNGWTGTSGDFAIVSNAAKATQASQAQNTNGASAGRQVATITVHNINAGYQGVGVGVKIAAGNANGYWAYTYPDGGTATLWLFKGQPIFGTELARAAIGGGIPTDYTVAIEYDGGTINAWFNGALLITDSDTDYSANERPGISAQNNGYYIDGITVETGPAASMEVTPDPVWVGGGVVELLATGTATTWTAGTPDSTTFSADHGSIIEQVITSTTEATLYLLPEEYLGPIVISETQHSLSDTINATLDPEAAGPGGATCRLTDDGAALINDAAVSQSPAIHAVMTTTTQILTTPPAPFHQVIAQLWAYLRYIAVGGDVPESGAASAADILAWTSGGYKREPAVDIVPSNTTIKQDLAALLTQFDELRTITGYDLQDVMNIIRGADLRSITEVYDAIAGIPAADLGPVLTRLDEIQGAPGQSLNSLSYQIAEIHTVNHWNLQNVKEWIDGRANESTLVAGIAAISGGIGGLALEIAALAAAEGADAASSAAGAASAAAALAWLLANGPVILDLLNQIKSLTTPEGNPTYHPPIWPGAAHVTYGAPLAIEANLPLLGNMHGVVVDVSGCQAGTRLFDYDGNTNYSHIGALAFGNEDGYLEPFQALGWAKGIYMPKSLAVASCCRLFRSRNVTGTVTPWTITS